MSFKKLLLTASALALLSGNAFADGGPVPEPVEPPPEPAAPPPEEPAPAPPPPVFNHWYLGLHGGAVWLNDMEFETPGGVFIDAAETDVGWGAGGALGYRFESGWRTEVEGTYRQNSGDFLFDGEVVGIDPVDVDAFSVMFNVLYDMNLGSSFVPYLGGGIGASEVEVDVADGDFSDDGWAFTYQFLGGFSIPMPNSGFELFADYRYTATAGLELDFVDTYEDNDEYRAHSVMGGVRINF